MAVGFDATAATNTFTFSPSIVGAESSGYVPSNGVVSISGASLNAGDVIVFDGLILNQAGLIGDNWAAINLNQGGYLGVLGANLGVLVRTGTGTSQCQIYTNAVAGRVFTGTQEVMSNRVVITLYVANSGSTANMGYSVQIDQGLTGSFTSSLTGTNLTFAGNAIALSFASHQTTEAFYPSSPQGIHIQLPDTNLLAGASDQSAVTVDYLGLTNIPPVFNPGFAYSSNNTNVCSVSSQGLLTATGAGSAVITVSYGSYADSNTVYVTSNPGSLLGIRLLANTIMPLFSTQQAGVRGDFANVTNVDLFSYSKNLSLSPPVISASNSTVLYFSANGVITATSSGIATATASYGGLTSSKPVSVLFASSKFIFDTFSDGFWIITNKLNGQCLTVSSNGASQEAYTNGATDQQFEILYNLQNTSFRIRQRSSYLCIGPVNGNPSVGTAVATIPVYTGVTPQQWYLVNAGNSNYFLVNAASGLALQTDNGSPANVTMATPTTNAAQYWGFSYQTHYPKKGCTGDEANYSQLGLSWAYNYADNTSANLPGSVNYVPMIHDANWEPLGDVQNRAPGWRAGAQPDYLLAYNEPDNSTQANMSTNTVIADWPYLQALNVPLVGTAQQTTFGAWAYNYYSLIASNNYRIDYSAAHLYVPPNASSMMSTLHSVYTTWGRPVWLTEFSPVDWSNTKSWSENDDYNFLAEFMWQAESQEWLKRYSIFCFSGTNSASPWVDNGYIGNFFFSDGATLTPYGELYATWDADMTLHARTAYLIHNLATSFRLTDTNTSSTPVSSTIYARNATTEWALLPASASNHWYIISLNDGRRLRNNGGTLDLAPVNTTNSACDWFFNGPDANGYYYIDNLAGSKSLKGSGTAPAISFSVAADPASGTAMQWRLVKPYQPILISTSGPSSITLTSSNQAVFLGWITNGTSCNIYRGTSSGGPYTKIVNATTRTNFTDITVQNGKTYYYVITTLNILGEESSYSAEAVAHPVSTTVQPLGITTMTNGGAGSGVQFNWASDHIGWRLQMNTNGLGQSSNWVTISGSQSTNQIFMPFDPTQSNVFFRLTYP